MSELGGCCDEDTVYRCDACGPTPAGLWDWTYMVKWHLRRWLGPLWPRSRRMREVDRRLKNLADAVAAVPSKHADPAFQARFLADVFAGRPNPGER